MSKFRYFSVLVVVGCVSFGLALAANLPAGTGDESQKAADIRWFLDRSKQAAVAIKAPKSQEGRNCEIAIMQARSGDLEGAKRTASGIENVRLKLIAFCRAAIMLASVDQTASAKKAIVFAKEVTAGIEEASADRSFAEAEMVPAHVAAGEFAAAMRTTAAMHDLFDRAHAYCCIAYGQAKAGNTAASKEAIGLAKQAATGIRGKEENVQFLCSVAKVEAELGDMEAAEEAFGLAKDAASMPADSPDTMGLQVLAKASTLCYIAQAQAHAGDFSGALRTAAEIEIDSEKARAYCWIAEAQAKGGDLAAFRDSIELAKRALVGTKRGLQPKAWVYCWIAEAQAKAGDITGSKDSIGLAKRSATGTAAAEEIAEAQAWAGDIAGAKQTAAAVTVEARKVLAYAVIAQAQARAGQVEEVKAWVDALREPEEVVAVCLGAVEGSLPEEGSKATTDTGM